MSDAQAFQRPVFSAVVFKLFDRIIQDLFKYPNDLYSMALLPDSNEAVYRFDGYGRREVSGWLEELGVECGFPSAGRTFKALITAFAIILSH